MTVVLHIPPETERLLQAEWGDLNQAAQEALVIESYRQGKLSLGQCSEIFGKTLVETERYFHERGIDLPVTIDEIEQDRSRLENLLI